MVKIIILLIFYFIIFIVSFLLSDKNIIYPEVSFILCFIPQIAYLLPFVNILDINLDYGTFITYLLGPILFLTTSLLVRYMYNRNLTKYRKISINNKINLHKNNISSTAIPSWIIICFLLFELIVLVLSVLYIDKNGYGASLQEKIYSFRESGKRLDGDLAFPRFIRFFRNFCLSSNYYFVYLLALSIINKTRISRLPLILIFIIGCLNSLLSGARGGVVNLIFSFLVQMFFLYLQKINWQFYLPFKYILTSLICAIVLIPLFKISVDWLGRSANKYSLSYYWGIYLSFELVNLDLFIKDGHFGSTVYNNQTFKEIINFISNHFDFAKGWEHTLDNPFRNIHGYNMGNVSTVYYAGIYDGGYIGMILYIVFMAVFCQICFLNAKNSINNNKKLVSIDVLLYSYLYYHIILSFFSPKFSENIISPFFIKMFISWLMLDYVIKFLAKIKIDFKKSF